MKNREVYLLLTRRLLTVVAVVGVIALSAVGALAQAGEKPEKGQRGDKPGMDFEKMLEKWDANGDGAISEDEFGGPENAFARLDANGDGTITRDEISGTRGGGQAPGDPRGRMGAGDPEQRWQKMLQAWDADNDGQISQKEFQGPDKLFDMLDADGDGAITEEEHRQTADQRRERENPLSGLIRAMDEDGDGRLSQVEWMAFLAGADADGDGFMSLDELMQQIKKMARPEPPAPAAAGEAGAMPAP